MLSAVRVVLAVTVVALLALAPAARGAFDQWEFDLVVSDLLVDHVHNAGGELGGDKAELRLTSDEVLWLKDQIDRADVYVAILPTSAGDPDLVTRELTRHYLDGTFAVVVGRAFRATSTTLPSGVAARLASEAFDARRADGLAAVLGDFVARVKVEEEHTASAPSAPSDPGAEPAPDPPSIFDQIDEAAENARAAADDRDDEPTAGEVIAGLAILAALVGGIGFVGFKLVSVARRTTRDRKRDRGTLGAVRAVARAEETALGEELQALDVEVALTGAGGKAHDAYAQALNGYERGRHELERATTLEQYRAAAQTLSHGRYWIATAGALAAGQPAPQYAAPCYLNPRHGRATGSIEHEVGDQLIPVPVCTACRARAATAATV